VSGPNPKARLGAEPIRAVKGTRDILPDEIPPWRRMEAAAAEVFARYGYREIRTPVFEETPLFARGIGADTDVVSKEMYSFEDRDEQKTSLTLRPEATAGIVRAVIEHNLMSSDPALKVYALGPMFRRERPQKGRYRQFHQVDVEAFGMSAPSVDVEVIEMAAAFLERCGIGEYGLVLNSVGDATCRPPYVERLRGALREKLGGLSPDSRRRTETNPLRVLDSKAPEDQPIIETLPRILDHLCPACREHFAEVRRQLGLLGIRYRLDERLVRGLDYYVRTTFEVTSGALGAQNSLLGGGRYDGLVKALGGPDLSGIGFAAGMERLALAMPVLEGERRCDVFIAPLAASVLDQALLLQRALREAGVRVLMDQEGRSFKSKMKLADRLGARLVAMRGEDEIRKGVWSVRDMATSTQEEVGEDRVFDHLRGRVHG
jgi:histidyl-tRNA synthetase